MEAAYTSGADPVQDVYFFLAKAYRDKKGQSIDLLDLAAVYDRPIISEILERADKAGFWCSPSDTALVVAFIYSERVLQAGLDAAMRGSFRSWHMGGSNSLLIEITAQLEHNKKQEISTLDWHDVIYEFREFRGFIQATVEIDVRRSFFTSVGFPDEIIDFADYELDDIIDVSRELEFPKIFGPNPMRQPSSLPKPASDLNYSPKTSGSLRLASFNVNSIRQRAGHVRRFLARQQPDLLFLQELKCRTEEFPALEFADTGYRVHAVGQAGGRNGVAVLGRIPFEVTAEALPGDAEDAQARYIEVTAAGMDVAGIYLPNGNSGGAEGYAYKLGWMARLRERAAAKLDAFRPFAILGDFNVCPTALDLAPGALPPTDALVRPETRAAWRALEHLGLTDALRALHPGERLYTYWDYGASFDANIGLRIDHALLSAEVAERLTAAVVDAAPRAEEKPSDHTPLIVALEV